MLKIIAGLGFLTLFIPTIASAEEYTKNGFPCVSELCLGDGIEDLSKIKWDRARAAFVNLLTGKPRYTSTFKPRDFETLSAKEVFRGNLDRTMPYLVDGVFDNEGLVHLSRLRVACSTWKLTGSFTSAGGNPTRVDIILAPLDNDTSTQKWTVSAIWRTFPSAITFEQKEEVRSQLHERYRELTTSEHGRLMIDNMGSGTLTQGLYLDRLHGGDIQNQLKKHPECGGSEKVKID